MTVRSIDFGQTLVPQLDTKIQTDDLNSTYRKSAATQREDGMVHMGTISEICSTEIEFIQSPVRASKELIVLLEEEDRTGTHMTTFENEVNKFDKSLDLDASIVKVDFDAE